MSAMTDDRPSDLMLAIAEVICAHHGRVYVPNELMDEVVAVTARAKAGTATLAAIELIERSLAEVPGYSQRRSQRMLDKALGKKALVPRTRLGSGTSGFGTSTTGGA
jgi:predicted nucleic acid-binding protein